MFYIFWKLLFQPMIWAIKKEVLSILRGVRFLLTQWDAGGGDQYPFKICVHNMYREGNFFSRKNLFQPICWISSSFQTPLNGPRTPEMDPKRSPQPPLIGLRLKLESYVLCQVIKKLVCFDINSPSPKVLDDSYLFSNANIEKFKNRVSLKKGTLVIFCLIQF